MTEPPVTPEHDDLEDVPDALQEYLLRDVEVSGRELGVGSYSSVVELRYKGMICAGKKLHRSLYDQGVAMGPEILERFGTECELLSQLRHPRIVQFLGLHIEEGTDVPILVLEFMPFALSDCIEHYHLFPAEVSYSILHDVSLGLHYLHENDPVIIHRDLTANNVLLTSNMTAKITDLGMAKIINLSRARMTHRMTVCPGTLSYMPPEALTSNPHYDTKLDSFSFGVLMLHIFCGEWPIASEYLQPDPNNPNHLLPLTEVQRREKYLRRLGSDHLLLDLIQRCLKNSPSERPQVATILEEVSQVASRYPPSFINRVEILNRVNSDMEEKQQLRAEIEELRRLLHEREHKVENLCFTYSVEMERMRDQVNRLEQTCKLQNKELSELRADNDRLRLSHSAKLEEVELLRRQVETLSSQLKEANEQLEKRAVESLKLLRELQGEVTTRSQEREAALQRLSRGQLDAALRHTFLGHGSEYLSNEFEEFFLHNADEISELFKRSQRSSNLTHLNSQQMVCGLVQHCYNHCKEKVVEQLAAQLERIFSVEHDLEVCKDNLKDISVAYGLLLRAAPLQKSSQYCDSLCEEAFPKFLEKNSIRLSRGLESSLKQHARQICRLSWELVTCWPPLISTRPAEFREEWQDREYQYWDKTLTKFRLSYTRPVLFHSYEGRVGVKGWVGNKEPSCTGGVRRTPPNERGRRRTGNT